MYNFYVLTEYICILNFETHDINGRKWVRKDWIDAIVPQLYWQIGFKAAAYEVLTEWWNRQIKGTKVQVILRGMQISECSNLNKFPL